MERSNRASKVPEIPIFADTTADRFDDNDSTVFVNDFLVLYSFVLKISSNKENEKKRAKEQTTVKAKLKNSE